MANFVVILRPSSPALDSTIDSKQLRLYKI